MIFRQRTALERAEWIYNTILPDIHNKKWIVEFIKSELELAHKNIKDIRYPKLLHNIYYKEHVS